MLNYYLVNIKGASTTFPYFWSTSLANTLDGLLRPYFKPLLEGNADHPFNIISKLPKIISFSFDLEIATFTSCKFPAAPTFFSWLYLTNEKITISACVPKAPVVVVTLILLLKPSGRK